MQGALCVGTASSFGNRQYVYKNYAGADSPRKLRVPLSLHQHKLLMWPWLCSSLFTRDTAQIYWLPLTSTLGTTTPAWWIKSWIVKDQYPKGLCRQTKACHFSATKWGFHVLEMLGFRLNYFKLETQKAREKILRSLNLYKYLKILLTRSNRLKKG